MEKEQLDLRLSDEDKEWVKKQIHKAVRSYDWESHVHELLDAYLDNMYGDSILDDMFLEVMTEATRKIFVDCGLIDKKG